MNLKQPALHSPPVSPHFDGLVRLDQRALRNIQRFQVQGEPDILDQIIELFVTHAPTQMAAAEDALNRGDIAKVFSATHNLRGSAANLGAQRMVAICVWLEAQARLVPTQVSVQDLLKQCAELRVEFELVKLELTQKRET